MCSTKGEKAASLAVAPATQRCGSNASHLRHRKPSQLAASNVDNVGRGQKVGANVVEAAASVRKEPASRAVIAAVAAGGHRAAPGANARPRLAPGSNSRSPSSPMPTSFALQHSKIQAKRPPKL